LLPESLLNFSVADGALVPNYFDAADAPWIRLLVAEYRRFEGRPQRLLRARLAAPMPFACPRRKFILVRSVLNSLWRPRVCAAVLPASARELVFAAASCDRVAEPAQILEGVAEDLKISVSALRESLLADLPGERLVASPDMIPSPAEVLLRANLALIQGLLCRSARVELSLEGNAHAIVRHAKLRGLICTARGKDRGMAVLDISGPLSLFHRTLLYGRALSELVPMLAWCHNFTLRAEVHTRGEIATLTVNPDDAILPSAQPRQFDSKLEERFARDFAALAPDWDIVRDPEPVAADGTLIFPDFALQYRPQPSRRYLLEIAGFWTPDYINDKLTRLARARLDNLILCMDAQRNCTSGELPASTHVLRFHRRLDASAVLKALESLAC
jgi:predicted nuclease of restriction endonuclease-like RecB superfamily